ncbi:MAG: hypothetical protein LIO79_02825 [Rikenellaceae bacterium]|nr:hypothetical protein [Rikenellaceae bacterium]
MKKLLLSLLLVLPFAVFAEIIPAKPITDNMILQRGKPVKIWGTGDPGEMVEVSFAGKNYSSVTDESGSWIVTLEPMEASFDLQTMRIEGPNNSIIINNIQVGEVWLASGQSNMEYSMNEHPRYLRPKKGDPEYLYKEYTKTDNPNIRVLYVKKDIRSDTLPTDGWRMADTLSIAPVSALAYFFAKKLFEELNIPVGIISTSWGGTPIEQWTPMEGYADSYFAEEIIRGKLDDQTVGQRFDKMVRPLVPYTLKGFLWYQGEQNLIQGDTLRYTNKMKVLVDSWRALWGDENNDMSFYYAQIAPHTYSQHNRKYKVQPDIYTLPVFWKAQTLAQGIPNTGMIVTTDLVDEPRDIHPPYKWIVGERFACLALAKDYGKTDVIYSGPVFQNSFVSANKMVIEFDHTAQGLFTLDGESPDWFEIAGEDGVYYSADAVIDGDKVVLSNGKVATPVAARFAWSEAAMPNLINSEGLPAVPFRTKDRLEWNYNKK